MRHFLTTEDWSRDDLQQMIDRARAFRDSPQGDALKGKSVALMFFNPSLRTRSSFDIGVHQLGGHAIVLDAQGQTWPLEFEEGAVMDGGPEEHVKEAARVLSRYVDLIAIRCFPKFQDWTAEREDPLITAYAKHATVPVINMETIVHPCQELAMMMAKLMGRAHLEPDRRELRAGDVKHSLADLARTKQAIGYEPIVPFDRGLEATVRWYESV